MPLQLEPLHPLFGARATGVDLARPLAPEDVTAIDAAISEFGVLAFPDQPLSEEQQMTLAFHFGSLDAGFQRVSTPKRRLSYSELGDISNVDETGQVAARNHRRIVGSIANQLWHSDSSFQNPPARYSMLAAVVLPSWGGNTEFVDLRVAYDSLDEAIRAEIAGYSVEHYALHSRFGLGDADYTEAQRAALPPVRWPLVKTHEPTGRKLPFIGAHATHIIELTVAEGRMLLQDLLEHATQPESIYAHEWAVGDLVVWDNRTMLHRGRRFDLSQRRELRRATTLDFDGVENACEHKESLAAV